MDNVLSGLSEVFGVCVRGEGVAQQRSYHMLLVDKGLTRVVVALKIVDSFTRTEKRVKARVKGREERWLEALWFE